MVRVATSWREKRQKELEEEKVLWVEATREGSLAGSRVVDGF